MPCNRTFGIAATAIAAFSVSAASGSNIDINGGTSWGGWDFRGQSTDEGIWAAGITSGVYEIY
ncbi:hypothetical protein RZS08_63215, partial [Arthrospira platensis SPKY1]|nr:hypothetical protein [Arthrospira platensis SPKY1]